MIDYSQFDFCFKDEVQKYCHQFFKDVKIEFEYFDFKTARIIIPNSPVILFIDFCSDEAKKLGNLFVGGIFLESCLDYIIVISDDDLYNVCVSLNNFLKSQVKAIKESLQHE